MDFKYTPLQNLFPKRGAPFEFNPGKFQMPIEFSDIAEDILEAEVRKEDVWLIGFIRTGTVWCKEIIWLIENNLDFDLASSTVQSFRFPKIEVSAYMNEVFDKSLGVQSVQYTKNMQSPRLIKTNLPYDLLPKQLKTVKPKIIYITRNPKDTFCSYYRHVQSFFDYQAPFDEAAKKFCEGKLPFGDMIDHCLPFWSRRYDKNILFLTYEDMRYSTKEYIKIIAEFLGKSLTSQQVNEIHDYVSLENMRNNPSVNMKWYWEKVRAKDSIYTFIYQGKVGGWKDEMSSEISKLFDDWIQKKTKGTGLQFIYD